MSLIHASAEITPGARIGRDVEIGSFTVIHGNVVIGDRCRIGPFCELGVPPMAADGPALIIGQDSVIRGSSFFYAGSRFGEGLRTGHHVVVRAGLSAGLGLQIGSRSELEGDVEIGDHVRLHSGVGIGEGARVGHFVWMFPYVLLTNDPHPPSDVRLGVTVHDFAVIAATTTILPGVTIGARSLVGANSLVTCDVPEDRIFAGSPARDRGAASEMMHVGDGLPAYPWWRHYKGTYPEGVIEDYVAGQGC